MSGRQLIYIISNIWINIYIIKNMLRMQTIYIWNKFILEKKNIASLFKHTESASFDIVMLSAAYKKQSFFFPL